MSLVPKKQQFFYLVVAGSLVVLAVVVALTVNRFQNPNLSTSKAYEGEEPMYEETSPSYSY
jgi:hypothetical protein